MKEFIRLDATPPQKAPPPADAVDLSWDSNVGSVKITKPDGSTAHLQSEDMSGYVAFTDLTSDGDANPNMPLKAAEGGELYLTYVGAGGVGIFDGSGNTAIFSAFAGPYTEENVLLGVPVKSGTLALTSRADGVPASFIPPTTNPHVAGAVWNNGGTLAISAG